MLRFFSEFVTLIVFFLVMRSAVSAVWKMLGGGFSVRNPSFRQGVPQPDGIRTSGELRKDPVCGTFVSTSTPYTKFSEGTTSYFCSKECLDLFKSGRDTQKQWQKSTVGRS
jgi:YHS domain-containing protein